MSTRVQRILSLGKLWAYVSIFHPWIPYKNLDWDEAFVQAVEKVTERVSHVKYATIVEQMTAVLGDPHTQVFGGAYRGPAQIIKSIEKGVGLHTTEDGIAIVRLTNISADECLSFGPALANSISQLDAAKAVIFDLRRSSDVSPTWQMNSLFNKQVCSKLCRQSLIAPAKRARSYSGFPADDGDWGYFFSAFVVRDTRSYTPGPQPINAPICFLINEFTEIPEVVMALQAQDNCFVISDTEINVDCQSISFPIEGGLIVRVRLDELIFPDGHTGFIPDKIIKSKDAAGQHDLLSSTVRLIRSEKLKKNMNITATAVVGRKLTPYYADTNFPTKAYRQLAAFRIWMLVKYFFAYFALIEDDWDQVLADFIPLFEKARNAKEYALTVSRMLSYIHDSHGFVISAAREEHFGVASPQLRCRFVEGKLVVTDILDAELVACQGIEIGDIIVSVDGKTATSLACELEQYFSASTQQSLNVMVAGVILNGPEGSRATVELDGGNGINKTANILRRKSIKALANATEPKQAFRKIANTSLGFVDFAELLPGSVDSMFEALQECKGIIFDLRGYPKSTGKLVSARLATNAGVAAAKFIRPIVTIQPCQIYDDEEAGSQNFYYCVPNSPLWKYEGKTVMLIDGQTMSRAELTGMYLKAANGTTAVGSPSAGAPSTVTNFRIPGNIWIYFSGDALWFPDGKQLQRVGLQPDVSVEPTIAGLRAGKDELLEKAIEYLFSVT